MLHSLKIRNFKALKDLEIHTLGRVNLITGRNNTGKSTLLEAVALYASSGDFGVLDRLLEARGESTRFLRRVTSESEEAIKSLSSFFSGRQMEFGRDSQIFIGGEKPSSNLFPSELSYFSMRFVRYAEEVSQREGNDTVSGIRKTRIVVEDGDLLSSRDLGLALEIRTSEFSNLLPIERIRHSFLPPSVSQRPDNFQLVSSRNIDIETNARLFDSIALSSKEENVLEALRIIEPLTKRLAFVEDGRKERIPIISLESNNQVYPLRSMGDGMNRVLTIILALANSDNGFLLIDEFENGLHYSVQEKLWKIVFSLSQKLNIQVFATTHSEDCIGSFESTLNQQADPEIGKLVRLENKTGKIRVIDFNAEELRIANEEQIEIR